MNGFLETLKEMLVEKGIHPSHQRLKILEYLAHNDDHPTADQIYMHLRQEMTTLSKMTVYNTLNVFKEAGVVRELTIENNEVRYDIITEEHGHFKCEECKKIYNFPINAKVFDAVDHSGMQEFVINQRDLYFQGLCPACLKNKALR